MYDPLGAFCNHANAVVRGATDGPLHGVTFAVKDLFDVGGFRTGAGNPDWLESHEPANQHADAVQRLLDAGATLVGKTISDEMAFSLLGVNAHYGAPVNPNAPGRVCGGSSSGSASATAGGLVDFALGTDTAGSVRIPASFCGLYGFRPTHGRIPLTGVVPLAPSFDTVGWFARKAGMLCHMGEVLLGEAIEQGPKPTRMIVAEDSFALLETEFRVALEPALARLANVFDHIECRPIFGGDLESWVDAYQKLRLVEIWNSHGAWIDAAQPKFGPGIRDRFEQARRMNGVDLTEARKQRDIVKQKLAGMLSHDAVICLPAAPGIAPRLDDGPAAQDQFRTRALQITCAAGLAGAPQVTLPLAAFDDCPLGISLLAAPGRDAELLALAEAVPVAMN